ncbi:isopentenyl phosphate kinase family protein [Patescibacteria group bacterium]|nr:isopentenyl phosphate kinase family protein [Patescibacteria group bacterium]
MKKSKLVIIKIGGSVITDKKNNRKVIKKDVLQRIMKEISDAKKMDNFSLIIVHGVGPFGHKIAKKFDLKNGYQDESQIKAVVDLYLNLKKLNLAIIRQLKKVQIKALTFDQGSAWQMANGRIVDCNLSIIKKYLQLGLTPVLHGDLLVDNGQQFGILSGDQIVYFLAQKLGAELVIIGTDVDGIFSCNPKVQKDAKLLSHINRNNLNTISLTGSIATDVTDGMRGKVNELILLSDFKIKSKIINLTKNNVLKKTLLGHNNFGTTIK